MLLMRRMLSVVEEVKAPLSTCLPDILSVACHALPEPHKTYDAFLFLFTL